MNWIIRTNPGQSTGGSVSNHYFDRQFNRANKLLGIGKWRYYRTARLYYVTIYTKIMKSQLSQWLKLRAVHFVIDALCVENSYNRKTKTFWIGYSIFHLFFFSAHVRSISKQLCCPFNDVFPSLFFSKTVSNDFKSKLIFSRQESPCS